MNISQNAIAKIRSYVTTWDTESDETILNHLNGLTISNPVAQANVPVLLTGVNVLGLLSQASAANVLKLPGSTVILDKINGQDRQSVMDWASALVLSQNITMGEAQSIGGFLQTNEPDPKWSALVSWSSLNIDRPLDLNDIATTRGTL